jgi:hypothetical protein
MYFFIIDSFLGLLSSVPRIQEFEKGKLNSVSWRMEGSRVRQYLGIVSVLILLVTFRVLQSLDGKYIGQWGIFITAGGYLSSAFAYCYSRSVFWKKASAAIYMLGLSGF